ncbi:MAG: TolC family protein [Chlorobi bacterium]|nr:TolC family protein [Chlorobiota bacterium]
MITIMENFKTQGLSAFLMLLCYIGLNTSVLAQQPRNYTLSEVIKIAQDQSPDALIAKHRFRRSYWSFRTFKATYLPGLKLNATLPNINRSINEVQGQDGTSVYTPQSFTNYSVDLSINQKIGFTGGEVFISSGIKRLDNFLADTSTTSYLTNMINIGISQPIFKYNPYKWDKIIEPIKYDEARRTYIETNENVAITALDRFFTLLLAQVELEIAKKNEANYDTLYRIAKGRYTLGKIAENDLLQLELNLLRAQSSVELSQLDYENKLFTFKSYLRIKSNDDIILIPPTEMGHFNVPVQTAIDQAKTNTSSGLAFQRRILEAESQLNQAKMDGRFDADLFAMFGLTQSSDNIPKSYQNPLDEERVTLGITIPILDWGKARGNIKMAESNMDLVQTAVDQDKIDFEQNIFIEVMQFNMQERQLMIAAKSDTVAQKRFDITQKRYMIGKVNDVLELNNAQIDNDNARKGFYSSLMTYWKSYYNLRKLTLFDFEHNLPIQFDVEELLK